RSYALQVASKKMILSQIPQVKIHSYGFHNNHDLTFSDVSPDWGLMTPGYSNGAVYADLDGDGDLDVVVNNINYEAHIYRNMSVEHDSANQHFLQVTFAGDTLNKGGFGAWVELHYSGGKQQVYENTPYRGYLSTIQDIAHFGLGKLTVVDTVLVKWPDGKMQQWRDLKANQVLVADPRNATLPSRIEMPSIATGALFSDITDSIRLHFSQSQRAYI